jgi:hypothetical protein
LSSHKKDNYGKTPIVNKYLGKSKLSTLLPIKEEYMIPKEDPELKSCFKQVQGVIINGYDNKKISIRFGEQIRETEALSVE